MNNKKRKLSDENFLSCDSCKLDFDVGTIDMDKDEFEFLLNKKHPGILWKCSDCCVRDKLTELEKSMNEKIIEFENQTNELTKEIEKYLGFYAKASVENMAELEKSLKLMKSVSEFVSNIQESFQNVGFNIGKEFDYLSRKRTHLMRYKPEGIITLYVHMHDFGRALTLKLKQNTPIITEFINEFNKVLSLDKYSLPTNAFQLHFKDKMIKCDDTPHKLYMLEGDCLYLLSAVKVEKT